MPDPDLYLETVLGDPDQAQTDPDTVLSLSNFSRTQFKTLLDPDPVKNEPVSLLGR